ncbi:MAG: CerR family C-terminal domain-containing protein [Planctomycetota bacterium]
MSPVDTSLKQRLLDAATDLFTSQGYRETSLREIAERAGVSHGSVRYHFGSKDVLFQAAIDELKPELIYKHFPRVPASSRMTKTQAVDTFKEFVLTLATIKARVGENPMVSLLYMESEGIPGRALNRDFYQKIIAPGHESLKRVIRAIRPDITDEETLEILTFNVIFQCVMLRTGRSVILKRLKKKTLSRKDIDRIADLIIEVSLGGIKRMSADSAR